MTLSAWMLLAGVLGWLAALLALGYRRDHEERVADCVRFRELQRELEDER